LIDMAESWLRLAQEQEASAPLGEAEPRQPKDDDKKE
jgi:hypothetical protein